MSRYHGDQQWTEMRNMTLHAWQHFDEDDFDILTVREHEQSVRSRSLRAQAKRSQRTELTPSEN